MNLHKYNLLKNAEEKAATIFRLDVPLIINEKSLPKKPISEQMGYYDCYKDKIILYINKIQQVASMFNLNLGKMVTHCVCHEFGHAKQARLFEDNQVCHWKIHKDPLCRIEIESVRIAVKLEEINLVNNWLQDFCIDRELYRHGIPNALAKLMIKDLELTGPEEIVTYVRMKSLPRNITLYEFGDLSDSEKNYIETTIKDSIGKDWDTAYNIMKSLELTEIDAYRNVIKIFIETIFRQNAYYLPITRDRIFEGRDRPSFWSETQYDVLHVIPKTEVN